jgi:hypothetical protein
MSDILSLLLGLKRAPSPSALPPGMVERGNIRLDQRPSVPNPEGGTSSVLSMGIGEGSPGAPREVVIPRVVGNGILEPDEATNSYVASGRHLGKFNDVGLASRYAKLLHHDQEAGRFGDGLVTPSAAGDIGTLLRSMFLR